MAYHNEDLESFYGCVSKHVLDFFDSDAQQQIIQLQKNRSFFSFIQIQPSALASSQVVLGITHLLDDYRSDLVQKTTIISKEDALNLLDHLEPFAEHSDISITLKQLKMNLTGL